MNSEDFVLFSKRFKEALILLQEDGRVLAFNPAAFQLLNREKLQLLHKNLSDISADSADKINHLLDSWKGSGEFLPANLAIKNSDGDLLDCTVEGCLLKPKTAKSPALLMLRCFPKTQSTKSFVVLNEKIQQLSKQIHERKLVEKGLRESEEKVRLLLHSTAQALYGVNQQGLCTFVNRACIDMLGFDAEEQIIGKNMHKLIHHTNAKGEQILEEKAPIFQVYSHAKEIYCENTMVWKKDGTCLPVEYWAHPIQHDGETIGAVVSLQNLSEKIQIEKALSTLAQSTSSVLGNQFFENCTQSIAEISKAKIALIGVLNQNNVDTLAIWSGESLQDNATYTLHQTSCNSLQGLSPAFIVDNVIDPSLEDELLRHFDVKNCYGVPLISSDGSIVGLVALLDDMLINLDERTDSILKVFAKRIAMELEHKNSTVALHEYRDHLEALVSQRTTELEQAYRDLESYSYSIAHDLRSPLRSITSFSQILHEQLEDRLDSTEQDYFNRIIKSSQFLAELITDILELSRISRREMTTSKFNLSQLVQEIVNEKIQQNEQRCYSIQIKDHVYVKGDKNLFFIMLDNLIENAIKFSEKKPLIRIEFGTYTNESKEIVCYLQDQGAGFNDQYKNKLFKPFQRLHKREEFDGTGIGLATVKRIIERHGGDIWVEGKIDEGACFYFTSPNIQLEEKQSALP